MLTTVGQISEHELPLAELAAQQGLQRPLAQLSNLTLGKNSFMLRDLIGWISTRWTTETLDDWADDRADLAELAQFAHWVARTPVLREAFPLPNPAFLTKERYDGFVSSHYLCAMVASRRPHLPQLPPVEADALGDYIQRLRLLLLVRALDAGTESGAWSEQHLAAVCLPVRQICEGSGNKLQQRLEWFEGLRHSAIGYTAMLRETHILSQRLLAKVSRTDDAYGRTFFRSLAAVTSEEPQWRAIAAPADQPWKALDVPKAPASPRWAELLADLPTADDDVVASITLDAGDEDPQTGIAATLPPDAPPARNRQLGRGLILLHLEDTLLLPWSWRRLAPSEQEALARQARAWLSDAPSAQHRWGAALVLLACLTSQTLTTVQTLRFGKQPNDDWQIQPDGSHLHRLPPRFSRRWQARQHAGWVQPMAERWHIALPPALQSVLQSVSSRRLPDMLACWRAVAGEERLEAWFDRTFTAQGPSLDRVGSAMLDTWIAAPAVQYTGDLCLGALLRASSRSALPAPAAYSSYNTAEIEAASLPVALLGAKLEVSARTSAGANAAGSELQADLARVRHAITAIRRSVEAAARSPEAWLDHHNRLTAYTVLALLASTGARPVASPFESLGHLDLDAGLVFVDDKQRGTGATGRLCVLGDVARDLVRDHYLPHLRRLHSALPAGAQPLADGIGDVLSGAANASMPLFFFLSRPQALNWEEVTQERLDFVCGQPWPLPWNWFRHLNATWLRREGVDADIRDALLGHGDAGAEPHGAQSLRTPWADFEVARPRVNSLARALGIELPRSAGRYPDELRVTCSVDDSSQRRFGRQGRAGRRAHQQQRTEQQARLEIERFVGQRPPQSLSTMDWERLARQMLVRSDGMPHSMGSLRYQTLETYLEGIWRRHGVRASLKRVHVPLQPAQGQFTEDAIGCREQVGALRAELDRLAQTRLRSNAYALHAALACLDVMLNSRCTAWPLITALALLREVKLVRWQGRCYLECAWEGNWVNGKPVIRVPVTARAVKSFCLSRQGSNQITHWPSRPPDLAGFGHGVAQEGADLLALLRRVAAVVRQLNRLELPGALAASLEGLRPVAALPHADWIRVTAHAAPHPGRASDTPHAAGTFDADRESLETPFRVASTRGTSQEQPADAATRCHDFFTEIRKVLSDPDLRVASRAAAIGGLLKASGFSRGDAPAVMAHFAVRMLVRPKKNDQGARLRASTALRYWYSLAQRVRDHAANINLLALEDTEVTELYAALMGRQGASADVLDLRDPDAPLQNEDDEADGSDDDARPSDPGDPGEARRALSQLRDFHEFAQQEYGLPDPDWSEIAPGGVQALGRPGMVLMTEYHAALRVLVPQDEAAHLAPDTLAQAFVLLVCARFGLRLGEAVGLTRADWVDVAETVVVLVRPNGIRSLKTTHSRRQVPQVEALTTLETSVVNEVLRRWRLRTESRRDTPLLASVTKSSFQAVKAQVSGTLLALLKAVTRHPQSTVHQLRHGYANRMLAWLWGDDALRSVLGLEGDPAPVRRLLLGRDAVDRRGLWVVARLLGHASPGITIQAYVHVLGATGPQAWSMENADVDLAPRPVLRDLDRLPLVHDYLSNVTVVLPAHEECAGEEPVLLRRVRFLRMRALLDPMAKAAAVARLPLAEARRVEAAAQFVSRRIAPAKAGQGDEPACDDELPEAAEPTVPALLAHVSRQEWNMLLELAGTVPDTAPGRGPSGHALDWRDTIGRRRQIVVFDPSHMQWVRDFAQATGLTQELALVYRSPPHPELELGWIRYEVKAMTQDTVTWAAGGKPLQLDVAQSRNGLNNHLHRQALVPSRAARSTLTSYVLLVLWLCWRVKTA